MLKLTGRKALITGGSQGIGARVARRFAENGCYVAFSYLSSKDRSEAYAKELRQINGTQIEALQGDVSKSADCKRLVQEATEKLDGLDIIVSNAGNTPFAKFDDIYALSDEEWDYTWHTLTMAQIWLLQAAKPVFDANEEGGCFLITNSVGGLLLNGSSLAYSVTRSASLHLAKCLAQIGAPKIRVNSVCPGWVATERAKRLPGNPEETYGNMAALKRVTTEDEIADAFLFLATNKAMTGERIRVDSGMVIV